MAHCIAVFASFISKSQLITNTVCFSVTPNIFYKEVNNCCSIFNKGQMKTLSKIVVIGNLIEKTEKMTPTLK